MGVCAVEDTVMVDVLQGGLPIDTRWTTKDIVGKWFASLKERNVSVKLYGAMVWY